MNSRLRERDVRLRGRGWCRAGGPRPSVGSVATSAELPAFMAAARFCRFRSREPFGSTPHVPFASPLSRAVCGERPGEGAPAGAEIPDAARGDSCGTCRSTPRDVRRLYPLPLAGEGASLSERVRAHRSGFSSPLLNRRSFRCPALTATLGRRSAPHLAPYAFLDHILKGGGEKRMSLRVSTVHLRSPCRAVLSGWPAFRIFL
jgi:hypothetical protein